jgi:hypothetical protein
MQKDFLAFFMAVFLIIPGCYRKAYYFSPFNGNNAYYHAIPLQTDSIKGASYVSGVGSIGSADDLGADHLFSFYGNFHRSFVFKNFNGYYGTNLSMGSFRITPFDYYSPGRNRDTLNTMAGTKFFGGYGVHGGMNMVLQLPEKGEWRILGVELSIQKEFGDYLKFRKQLPIDQAEVIDKRSVFVTAGINTNIIFNLYPGSVGIKFALGTSLHKVYGVLPGYRPNDYIRPLYFTATLHFTKDRTTGFLQAHVARFAQGLQLGMSYRLGK